MKIRFAALAPLLLLLLSARVRGAPQAAAAPADAPRELMVEVVDSLGRGPGRITDFDRINVVFTEVFKKRKWPVNIVVERFAANTPAHDAELRIFYEGTYDEAPGDLTFHAWMTFFDHGTKRDFGVIRYRYNPRPLQPEEDSLERAFRGAAVIAADRIEAILFPKAEAQKP